MDSVERNTVEISILLISDDVEGIVEERLALVTIAVAGRAPFLREMPADEVLGDGLNRLYMEYGRSLMIGQVDERPDVKKKKAAKKEANPIKPVAVEGEADEVLDSVEIATDTADIYAEGDWF